MCGSPVSRTLRRKGSEPMSEPPPVQPLATRAPVEHVFPTLTPAQVARIAAHGRVRPLEGGEVLVGPDEPNTRFFVVRSGHLEVLRTSGDGEQRFVLLGSGQFTGEISTLSGRRGVVRIRAVEPGEVIELDRHDL